MQGKAAQLVGRMARRGDWLQDCENTCIKELMERLRSKVDDLEQEALACQGYSLRVWDKAADVANYAMLVIDACESTAFKEEAEPAQTVRFGSDAEQVSENLHDNLDWFPR